MAFSNTVTKVDVDPQLGLIYERGTWDGDSVTTGTIVPGAGTGFTAGDPIVHKIVGMRIENDNDNATVSQIATNSTDKNDNALLASFTSSDTGSYEIWGKGA
jgi:hypothetical protein